MFEAKELERLATALSVTADELQVRMIGHVVTAGKEAVKTKPQLQAATTLPQRVYLSQPPRLPTFAGEAGYDSWRAEVDKLQQDKSLTADDKYRAVSKSLHGKAGRVERRLGPDIDNLTLLTKLEKKFARTARGQHLMRVFYSLQQEEDEDVSSWACRMEDLLDQAKDAKRVQDSEMNELLWEQFWTGLRGDLQSGTEHKYDSLKNVDDLEDATRQVERDRRLKGASRSTAHHGISKMSQRTSSDKSELQELKNMFRKMKKRMDLLQQDLKQIKLQFQQPLQSSQATVEPSPTSTQVRRCFTCGDPHHLRPDCPQRNQLQRRQRGRGQRCRIAA